MFVFLVSLAAAVTADPSATTEPKSEKMVCRRVNDNSTGWRLESNRKVCRTAAEWRSVDDETQRALNKAKDKGMFDVNGLLKGR